MQDRPDAHIGGLRARTNRRATWRNRHRRRADRWGRLWRSSGQGLPGV